VLAADKCDLSTVQPAVPSDGHVGASPATSLDVTLALPNNGLRHMPASVALARRNLNLVRWAGDERSERHDSSVCQAHALQHREARM
jgi:hypothetical protein